MTTERPSVNVVFVHGAWADSSGFAESIRAVQQQGHRAIAPANPLRDLAGDSAYLAAVLGTLSGPIVLVGHSYGAAVISNAATGNAQVAALVFVNGYVPDEGESVLQLAQLNEGSLIPESLQPLPYTAPDGSQVVDLYLAQEKFPEAFAGDVDPALARVMAATQRPVTQAALVAPSGPVAWKQIPSWYQLGSEDRAIPATTQRYMAERAKATIREVPASHASMVSQPEATTDLILSAVAATAGTAVYAG